MKLILGLAHWISFFTYFQSLLFWKCFSAAVMTSLWWLGRSGLGVIFWWNMNICDLWMLGSLIFWKITPKHARSTLGYDRLQNFDHVAPYHGYGKKLDVIAFYIRHRLNLCPTIRSPNFFFNIFLKIRIFYLRLIFGTNNGTNFTKLYTIDAPTWNLSSLRSATCLDHLAFL